MPVKPEKLPADHSSPHGLTIGADGSIEGITTIVGSGFHTGNSLGPLGAWITLPGPMPIVYNGAWLIEISSSFYRDIAGAASETIECRVYDDTSSVEITQGFASHWFSGPSIVHIPHPIFLKVLEPSRVGHSFRLQERAYSANAAMGTGGSVGWRILQLPPNLA